MNIRILTVFLSFLVIGMISGCGSIIRPIHPANYQREIDLAGKLSERGDYNGAARIYRKLAKISNPAATAGFLYLAAESLYQAGEIESARQLADSTIPADLSLTDGYRLRLLYGRIFLATNQTKKTLDHLEPLPVAEMSREMQLDYHTQRAKALSKLGKHLESATEHIQLGQLLRDPEAIKVNQIAIIDELNALSNDGSIKSRSSRLDLLIGWLELTRIFKQTKPGTHAFDQRVQEWKRDYPGHPAILAELFPNVVVKHDPFRMPESIAVLLPFSGPFAQAGEAIRQGILMAREYNTKPEVATRFYNSDLADPVALYRQVVADGANIIIGPLEKDMLKSIATRNQLSVPVLGLNQLPGLDAPNLYQFGLNPEDEVEQAAISAWFDGYYRALIYAPANPHGRRLATAFIRKWKQLGGETARSETYDPESAENYDHAVRQFLHREGNESRDRSETSSAAAFRTDGDFIFLVAQPSHARLIKPLLDVNNAGHLAVYGTSQVFSGHENPSQDRDLSGIVFCDIPWLFKSRIKNAPTLEAVRARWQHPASRYVRLMALGFDAYNLLPHLPSLESDLLQSYPGLTGNLSLIRSRRIHRQLVCAKFQNGVPVPRSLSPGSNQNSEQAGPLESWSN